MWFHSSLEHAAIFPANTAVVNNRVPDRSPKTETRKPKEIRNPKTESPTALLWLLPFRSSHIRISGFGFPSAFGFRTSDLCLPASPRSVFTIRNLNTNPLSRLPRGGLGEPWYHPWYRPIPVEHSQSPIFDQASLSKARKPIAEPAAKRRKRRKRDGNSAFSCAFCAFSRLTHLPPEV